LRRLPETGRCGPRVWLFAAAALGGIVAALLLPPLRQGQSYLRFADARTLWGIPNCLNVVSNGGFLLAGLMGLWFLAGRDHFIEPRERAAYAVFFFGRLLRLFRLRLLPLGAAGGETGLGPAADDGGPDVAAGGDDFRADFRQGGGAVAVAIGGGGGGGSGVVALDGEPLAVSGGAVLSDYSHRIADAAVFAGLYARGGLVGGGGHLCFGENRRGAGRADIRVDGMDQRPDASKSDRGRGGVLGGADAAEESAPVFDGAHRLLTAPPAADILKKRLDLKMI